MCVMNRRKEKEEQKDNQVKTEVMRLAKTMEMTIPESKQKIESGGITTDIAENENMNISLLPKDIQQAIEYYEKLKKEEQKDNQVKTMEMIIPESKEKIESGGIKTMDIAENMNTPFFTKGYTRGN